MCGHEVLPWRFGVKEAFYTLHSKTVDLLCKTKHVRNPRNYEENAAYKNTYTTGTELYTSGDNVLVKNPDQTVRQRLCFQTIRNWNSTVYLVCLNYITFSKVLFYLN